MERRYIITIDLGTSSTKTALWDETGRLVAQASQTYTLNRPHPLWAEIESSLWWQAICASIRAVIAKGNVDPQRVSGIGVDGVGWTLVSIDGHGNSLHPAMIWLDRRADQETQWLKSLPDANRLVTLVANPLDPAYITPKLLWLKAHRSDIFRSARRFLTSSGFIVACLTGEFMCDYTQAYGYHFFDIANERWDEQAADRIGVPLEKMPRLGACTDIAGQVTRKAAEQTYLPAGIPVIVGCLDAAAGALGAGVTRSGQTNEQGGQAGGMAISLDHIVVEPQLIFSHHVLPGQYLMQGGTVGGGSLGWFRDVLGEDSFESIDETVKRTPAGAHGLVFLPYMAGERTPLWNSHARGIFFGLSYKTIRGDMLRAIMEGCAFAVYDSVCTAEQKGASVNEYLGSGGATQSAVWCQIKADVYGKPFVIARREDGGEGGHLLGLFALTAKALGWCDDAGECVERLLPKRQVIYPSPERHAMYQDLFGVYLNVSRKMLAEYDHLAAVTQKHKRWFAG